MKEYHLTEPTQTVWQRIVALIGLLMICSLSFFFGLGRLAFVGPDEPRYAEVAREMFVSGDYISPRICGHLWLEKPVLLYWGEAAAYHLFGINEFAARFPSAFAAVLSILFLYHAISSTISSRLAFIVSTILATSGLFIGYARAAVTDMLLTSAMSAAITCLYLYTRRSGRARLVYWSLGLAAVGVAALAKGLTGIVLVVAILAFSYFITRHPQAIRWREIVIGLSTFLAVVSIWYVPVIIENGRAFINEFFINQHFKRYLSNRYSHPQPLWFFPLIILAGAVPWTFYLLPAAARLPRIKPRNTTNKEYLLSLSWIWLSVPLVFFSLSKSKLPGYILPAFPALAIIIGIEVEKVWKGDRGKLLSTASWLTAGLLISIGITLLIYLSHESIITNSLQSISSWVPLTIGLAVVGALLLRKTRMAFIGVVASILSSTVLASILLLPRLDDKLSQKRLALTAAAALRPGEKIAIYGDKTYAAVFYSEGRVIYSDEKGDGLNAFTTDEIAASLETNESEIVITAAAHESDLKNDKRFCAEMIGKQGNHSAIRVSLAPPINDVGKAKL